MIYPTFLPGQSPQDFLQFLIMKGSLQDSGLIWIWFEQDRVASVSEQTTKKVGLLLG